MKHVFDPIGRTLRITFANGAETTIEDLDESEAKRLLEQLDVELTARGAALTGDGFAAWRALLSPGHDAAFMNPRKDRLAYREAAVELVTRRGMTHRDAADALRLDEGGIRELLNEARGVPPRAQPAA
jgi:hypothetical protein